MPNGSRCECPVGTQPYPTGHGGRIAGTNRFAYCNPCGFCGLPATHACPYTLESGCQDHPRSLVGETTCTSCQSLPSTLSDLGDGYLSSHLHTTHYCPRLLLGLCILVWPFTTGFRLLAVRGSSPSCPLIAMPHWSSRFWARRLSALATSSSSETSLLWARFLPFGWPLRLQLALGIVRGRAALALRRPGS